MLDLNHWMRRFRLELGSVLALTVVAGGVYAFLRIADEVREGDTHALDNALLMALRNPANHADPIGPAWLEGAMRDLTSLGGFTVLTLLTVAVIVYLALDGKRAAALLVAVSVGGGTLLSSLLKLGFDRPRPGLVSHLVDVHTLSFPSGHAMVSAVTYITLGTLLARVSQRRRIKVFVVSFGILLALMVGVSRVYLGVHWPTDVLGGWALGSAWAMLCWAVARYLQNRGKVERASRDPSEGNGDGNQAEHDVQSRLAARNAAGSPDSVETQARVVR